MMQSSIRPLLAAGAPAVLVLSLAACGSSSSGASAPASGVPSPTSRPGGGSQQFQQFQQFQQIRDCLTAAGISVPTPSGRPANGTPPTGMPGRLPPSARPSGALDGQGGTFFRSKKVRAALKACGLAVPTARPTAPPTPTS